MNNNIFETKDKHITPFLFTQDTVKFEGTRISNGIVYFKFSSAVECQNLVNRFISKTANPVQPKDLLEAVETFRDRVFEMKDGNKANAKT